MTGPDGRPGDGFMLGVDLGTSHTVAMLRWPDGRTRPLLFDGQPLLPSAGYLDTAGRLHVGRDALRLGYAEPGRFEPHPKRHIDDRTVLLGGAEVPVVDLLAALLGAVAREAVAVAGLLPPAVLTHPAGWGQRRREVLTEAVSRAGWPGETRLLPEPVAAARYFGEVLRRPVPVGSALAVFDFGGGTLDIAVVRNEGPGADGRSRFVLAGSGGIDDLGGLDLDAALVDHLGKSLAGSEPQAWQALTEPVTLAQWRARRQFWEDVRGAKEMLTRTAFAPVSVPGVEHAVQLTRDELEATAGPLVRRGVTEAGAVIRAAGLAPRELAGLFLVGGSSRVPLVARLLHAELGVAPTVLEQPEFPVAEGAIVATTARPAPSAPPDIARPAPAAPPDIARPAPAAPPDIARPAPAAPPDIARPAPAAPPDIARPALSAPPGTGRPAVVAPRPATADLPATEAAAPVAPPANAPTSPAPHYAEPVDPWATAAGASSFGAVPGPAEPWLASTQPDPADDAGAGAGGRPYRKRLFWLLAAAAAVLLGVATTLVVVFWPRYSALDFHPLGEARHVPAAVPLGSSFTAVAVRGDRVFFANADSSGSSGDLLGVVSADARSGQQLKVNRSVATAARWEQFVVTPDVAVAFSARDYTTDSRIMVVLDQASLQQLWRLSIGADDNIMFSGDVAVQVDRKHHQLIGLDVRRGTQRWVLPTPNTPSGANVAVVKSTTVEDDAGPASTEGTAFTAPVDDDTRIVEIGADRSARVIDAVKGTVQVTIDGVADPDDEIIAHHGRLVVAESGTTRRIVEYNLAKSGLPKVLYTAPTEDTRFKLLTECGADRVCFVATTGYSDTTAKIVAVDAVKGRGRLWDRPLTGVQSLVPVGDSVLVVQESQVSLINGAGKVVWTRAGVAARLNAGNVLLFSVALTSGLDHPSLAGEHLGDDPQQLGSIINVRSSTCAWDTAVIACAGDKDFLIQKFAG